MSSADVNTQETSTAVPDRRTALELAHAMLAEISQQAGVRCLFFKGLAAAAAGLRSPDTVPSDVDAYVDPHDMDALLGRLARLGFRARPVSAEIPRLLAYHSVTMVHPQWPCDLDLHSYVPGFFADSQQVFDRLWEHHTEIVIAGVPVAAPSVADHLLLLAINATRDPSSAYAASDVTMVRERGSSQSRV